jgi:hypothetical protein
LIKAYNCEIGLGMQSWGKDDRMVGRTDELRSVYVNKVKM